MTKQSAPKPKSTGSHYDDSGWCGPILTAIIILLIVAFVFVLLTSQ